MSQQRLLCLALLSISMLLSFSKQALAWQSLSRSTRRCPSARSGRPMVVSSYDLHPPSKFSSSSSSREASPSPMILDPLVVCGPSGVGKGTIIHKFQQDYPDLARHFGFTVSHTTRAPRAGEVDGVHYHFVSHKDMAELRAADAFLESAEVHGNVYGTSWQALRDVQQNAGQRCLLDIDVQGVQRLKVLEASMATNPQADFGLRPNYVFIAPPTLEALQDRLHGRQSETAESLQRRFANAAAEVAYGQVEGHFNAVVVNADLDQAVADFVKAVQGFYQL